MSTETVVMIPLERIINKFDVRIALDEDRVIQFAGLIEGGVELPPAKVVAIDEDTYAYIDGRHRAAARKYLNLSQIPCVVCNGSLRNNPLELFAEALESNWGGSKPPTREDITHTILRMLELGAAWGEINSRLSFLPKGSVMAYIASAQSVLQKRRLALALDAISDGGISVENAATKFGLKLDFLKNVISGKKGKWGGARRAEDQLAIDFKSYISTKLNSANAGIANKMSGLLQKIEDGEVSAKVAAGVIKSWHDHLRRTQIRVDDWKARLESIVESQSKSVGH